MKFLVILLISVISLVAADGGEYVPKAFYFLDENGRPSIPQPITRETLNRVRRQVQPGFNQNFGGFAFPQPVFNFPQINPAQGSGSFVSSSQTLSSRFGDDEPVVSGQTQVFHQSGGQYHSTTTNLRPDGTTDTKKQSGRVKRDMSQTQSQGNEDGMTQFQSQTQNSPGGVQIQSQSQPKMSQTQSQGDNGAQFPVKGSFDNIQEPEEPSLNSEIANNRAQNAGVLPPPQQHNNVPSNQNHQPPPQQHNNVPSNQNHQPPPSSQQHNNIPSNQQSHVSPNANIPPQQQQHGSANQHIPQGPQPQQQHNQYPNQQPYHPQQQPFNQQFPFGFGQFGFPQNNFGFQQPGFFGPAPGFGFPQAGGFGAFPQQQQPGFVQQPGFGQQPAFGQLGSLDNRFGEDEVPVSGTGTFVGGSQTVTSQNGNYQITSSVLKPDGQVVTSQQSGKFPAKKT